MFKLAWTQLQKIFQHSMLLFFKIIFSGLALWWVLRQVNLDQLHSVFKELTVATYSYALLTMSLCVCLNGLRLCYISKLIGIKNSFKSLHNLTWSGTFFNQLLPGGIGGDAYRIYALTKKNSSLLSTSAILWDRILGLACMGLICVPILFFIKLPSSLKIIALTTYSFLVGGIVILMLFIRFPILQNYKLINKLWKILALGEKFISKSCSFLAIAALTATFVNFAAFYLLIIALQIPLNFWESCVLYTFSLLITMIPISISGWGLRESFLTGYLITYGLPPEKGFTLGILQGLLMLAVGGIGAIFYLFSKNHKNSLGTTL